MTRLGCILLIAFMFSCDTERNVPVLDDNTFVKFYGNDGEQTGVDFVLTADGSIVMVGNSALPGRTSMIYVVKVDLKGNVIWENFIGLSDKPNYVKDIELHPDGRLIIAGETEITPGNRDIFLKIMSGSGAELDSTRYSLTATSDEEVNSVTIIGGGVTTTQSGFIVSGATTAVDDVKGPRDIRDGMHVRFIDEPTLPIAPSAWLKTTGKDNSEDVIVKAIQIDANRIHFFGYTNVEWGGSGDFKYWVFSLNDAGVELYEGEALFDILGQANEDEILKAVIDIDIPDLFDRGFLLTGVARNNAGVCRSYVVRLDRSLQFNNENQFYPSSLGSYPDAELRMNGFYNSISNDFLILGTQNINSNLFEDFSLFKLDRQGSPVWGPYAFGGESFDEAGAVLQLADGKIMVMGTMTVGGLNGQKKMALLKLNSEGKLLR
ncbi:MAG: hypothetical protein KIT62_14020 [Cyclobacteriaceae bacterium]|nr:hypothetical protein [Cyclobacteriaceae bacterium]